MEFQVGDEVTVTNYNGGDTIWNNKEGIIKVVVISDYEPFPIGVEFYDVPPPHLYAHFSPSELSLTNKFSNIPEPNDEDII